MTTQTIAEQQRKFVIKIDKNIERAIDSVTRKKLVNAYMKLFSGFAWVNWTKKQSLGRAWQSALGQCEGFLQTKNKSNPVTKYLDTVAKSHKAYWSRIIMTNKNSPNTINKTPAEIKQLQQYGEKLIRESMDTIKLIIAQHNEYIEEITGTEKTPVKTPENKSQKQTIQTLQTKPVQQQIAQPQAKPVPQVQQPQQQIAQPQVKPVPQVQQPQQQIVQPQVKPVPQVQQPQQQIAPLNSANAQHVVKQRINLFIMAKYNQKAA